MSRARRWRWGGLFGSLLLAGCLAPAGTPQPRTHPAAPAGVARTLDHAQQHPDDWRAQYDAGSALTREVLEGDVSRFDEAVAHLERARALAPHRRHIPRALGRLLNLPLAEGDLRWVEQQRDVYAHLDRLSAQQATPGDRFVDHCFLGATEAAATYNAHDPVGAAVQLRRLERQMKARLSADDDVDLHAMLGNYAQQIAGLTSVGRERRIALAIEHLEPVVQRWDELSLEAQGLAYGVPGVRAVFTHWLAELHLADRDVPRAHQLYAQVEALAREPEATPAMQVLAEAARRRRALRQPPPRDALLPLWPAGYDSCVACHAHEAVPYPEPPSPPGVLARR